MDHSATFARHFVRLVSLLMHDAPNIDEQKTTLRALVTLNEGTAVVMTVTETRLEVNGALVPPAWTGVTDVVSQMVAHSLLSVAIGASSSPADLLGVARILASRAMTGDGGAHALAKLAALNAQAISSVTQPASAPTGSAPTAVFAALDSATSMEATTHALDELVLLGERCVRSGQADTVAELLHGVMARDAALTPGDRKRAYILAVRRLAKPAVLRSVATLIVRRRDARQFCCEILEGAGEDGADAVIEQIAHATTEEDRRALLDVLGALTDAVTALRRMLGDARWFVVRNAAELLGELGATSAQADLIALVRHEDDRVRRATTNALLRLGTPAPTLLRVVEDENDADVQLAVIAAFGRVATADAVQELVRIAERDGRFFRKKATAARVAAVQALGEARTPAALVALRDLAKDKDREVRDTATRALAQATRQVTAP